MTGAYDPLEASPYATYAGYLRQGQLAYQVAPDGQAIFFPRVAAPGSGSTQLEWRVSRGLGTVYATTAMHARGEPPLNLALIDMDEGFRLMSRVEGLDATQVRIGQRVQFHAGTPATEGADPFPLFTLLEEVAHG